MQHFIWVFTVCNNTHLGVSHIQSVNLVFNKGVLCNQSCEIKLSDDVFFFQNVKKSLDPSKVREHKHKIVFLFLNQDMCSGQSKEPSQ